MTYKKLSWKYIICFMAVWIHMAWAKEHIMSPLPVPEQEVAEIYMKKCSKSCLNRLYINEEFFSFAASFTQTKDKALNEKYQEIITELDIKALPMQLDLGGSIKIALMVPQKNVGRYSVTSADSIVAYLIARGENFAFKVFDSQNEEVGNLVKTYNAIESGHYDVVIAILTPRGLENLLQNVRITTPLFIPTINAKQAAKFAHNRFVFFGGIDYEKQVDMMLGFARQKQSGIISFNDDGMVGKMIGNIVQSRTNNAVREEVVNTQKSTNFAPTIAKFRQTLKGSVVLLNTSVIKSGLIVPQMGNERVMPIAFLSTQINYNPSLLGLMPKEDAKRLFVVSAISPIHARLLMFNEILSADLQYDWVNYATALSVDMFVTQNGGRNLRFFTEKLQGNQIIYNDTFYGVQDSHFIPTKLP